MCQRRVVSVKNVRNVGNVVAVELKLKQRAVRVLVLGSWSSWIRVGVR